MKTVFNGIMKNKINKNSTLREVLQIVGTELLREGFNKNIHVASTMANIKDKDNVIITDMRFPNEVKAIKEKDGITIRINRETDYVSNHSSEIALDNYEDFDYTIDNNNCIDCLIEKVKEILKHEKII